MHNFFSTRMGFRLGWTGRHRGSTRDHTDRTKSKRIHHQQWHKYRRQSELRQNMQHRHHVITNNFLMFLEGPKVIVRTEEVLIVGLVLILWVGAIALFFNRWGKIRMLEPYQPKFQQQHRSSCPLVDIESLSPINHPRSSFSRMSMGCSLQIPPGHFGSMSGPSRTSLCNVKGMSVQNIQV